MKTINLSDTNSVLNQFLAEIRDREYQRNRQLFRQNVRRIGAIMAYEISKDLAYAPTTVATPLGTTAIPLPTEKVVIATVFRAGIPFQQGFLDIFDHADAAFVSAYRYYTNVAQIDVAVHTEYLSAPALDDTTLLLVDPMLATGESLTLSYNTLMQRGTPQRVVLAAIIAAEEGIAHLHTALADVPATLYVAAIDPALNEKKYIVPGLGDAGDLCFGDTE